jgi:hypothetical protein
VDLSTAKFFVYRWQSSVLSTYIFTLPVFVDYLSLPNDLSMLYRALLSLLIDLTTTFSYLPRIMPVAIYCARDALDSAVFKTNTYILNITNSIYKILIRLLKDSDHVKPNSGRVCNHAQL